MRQGTLFDPGQPPFNPPHNHTETSAAAARQVRESEAEKTRRRIYEVIRNGFGATDAEIQEALDLPGDRERPRRAELVKAGLVQATELTRPTPAGRDAIVWMITGKRYE